MSLLLAVLMQVGPFSSPDARPASPLPPELQDRSRRHRTTAALPPLLRRAEPVECTEAIKADPVSAAAGAQAALAKASGLEKISAGQCLGMALTQSGRWDDAAAAFKDARALIPADAEAENARWSARLGGMQGVATLEAGHNDDAAAVLASAVADARRASSPTLAGDLQVDQARALLRLGRVDEAGATLDAARAASPTNAEAWLGSATLSRKAHKLDQAQAQIARAGELDPRDPAIGIEAGVIAILAGREDAARKSWQSVILTAPDSPEAAQARAYLDQLGGQSATPAAAGSPATAPTSVVIGGK
ncbi:MAG: tetratricopeptide repeat protein [Novosphingobium sp.]